MLGLIKKDFLIIKGNSKIIIIMLFIFFIMTLQGQNDLSFIIPFISTTMFISTFSYDEYNKWDAYAITLPNGRKNVVKSKYIASLILIALAAIITILLNYLIGVIRNDLELDKFIQTFAGSILAIILIESIIYPLIFKFGIEKGRIWIFILSFFIVGVVGLFSKIVKISIPNSIITIFNNYWFIIIPIVIIIMLFISYKISEKIYSKKEF